MKEVVGIQFKNNSRLYYFAPNGETYNLNEYAIVETIRGMELGKVIIPNRMVEDEEVVFELKEVLRKANDEDIKRESKHQELAQKNFAYFKKIVNEMELEMKPLYCEYTIDGSKILFYYTAEDRVDFRNLVKLLASEFKTRIELRQIGSREAARVIGGIGSCGREICCKSCLNNFDFVTMKMAKDQNMSLNVNKISGVCGKLMCCIGYEHEMYCQIKSEMPKPGEFVKTPNGTFKVKEINCLKREVVVTEKKDDIDLLVSYKEKDIVRLEIKNPMEEAVEEIISSEEIVEQPTEDLNTKQENLQPKKKKQKKFKKAPKKVKKQNNEGNN